MSRAARKLNINMRTTESEKSLLEKAANLAGFSNLTNFMMTVARKEAYRILNDENIVRLTQRDWNATVDLLSNPPEPNEHLKSLLNKKDEDFYCEVDTENETGKIRQK